MLKTSQRELQTASPSNTSNEEAKESGGSSSSWMGSDSAQFEKDRQKTVEAYDQMIEDEGKRGDEEQEEPQDPLEVTMPSTPSEEERRRHMLTHLPFRDWCPHCVRGKAKGNRTGRRTVNR